MQDTSIKGNGTSRYIKGASNFPTSFEEFRRQIMAGTLTADIGLNPAGCDVVGTALSKANLLTDQTAKLLSLTGSSTVNEAFEKIAKWKGAAGGVCALDSEGKVPMRSLHINERFGIPTLDANNAVPFSHISSNAPGLEIEFGKIDDVVFTNTTAVYDTFALGNRLLLVRYHYEGTWYTPGVTGSTSIKFKIFDNHWKFQDSSAYPMLQSIYTEKGTWLKSGDYIGDVQGSSDGRAIVTIKCESNVYISYKGIFIAPIVPINQ